MLLLDGSSITRCCCLSFTFHDLRKMPINSYCCIFIISWHTTAVVMWRVEYLATLSIHCLLYCLFQIQSAQYAGIQCQICHMRFIDQSALNSHYDTVHAPDRPRIITAKFECSLCCKKYTSAQNLRFHRAKSHGIGELKTFSCQFCDAVYREKRSLLRHVQKMHEKQMQWLATGLLVSVHVHVHVQSCIL